MQCNSSIDLCKLNLCVCVWVCSYAATVLSGTAIAREIHKEIQTSVEQLVAQGNRRPHLAVILVGDDAASRVYVRNKTRAASLLGNNHIQYTL